MTKKLGNIEIQIIEYDGSTNARISGIVFLEEDRALSKCVLLESALTEDEIQLMTQLLTMVRAKLNAQEGIE